MIKTYITHPQHLVIGRAFISGRGHYYFCDSYDPACGFWMTRWDFSGANTWPQRTNVSERAIGRTFHEVGTGFAVKPGDQDPRVAVMKQQLEAAPWWPDRQQQ